MENTNGSTVTKKLYTGVLILAYTCIYATQKVQEMCSSAYCNKSSKKLEIQTLVCYKVSFYLSNEVSFDLVALAVAGKNSVKVDSSSIQFSQNCNMVWFE